MLPYPLAAPLRKGAFTALWITGSTGITAVEYQPVMGNRPQLHGNMAFQILLDRLRSLPVGEAETMGNPENMGIYRNDRLIVNN